MKCCVCGEDYNTILLHLNCGGFDQSVLYKGLNVILCEKCGHIFNLIKEDEKEGIIQYYNTEYSLSNLQSPNKQGDMPGSENENSLIRYDNLYETISDYIKADDAILDIGCATGGFLKYLHSKSYKHLYGIDFSVPYINESNKFPNINVKVGSAENIPFSDDTFDFVSADQVVEHLFDPNRIFEEVKRVIKKNGYFSISLPNAFLYSENYPFDYYFFLMREHIQHFDLEHLINIAGKHGFEIRNYVNKKTRFFNKETFLPNLITVFQYTGKIINATPSFTLVKKTKDYLNECSNKLEKKKEQIRDLYKRNVPLYIYGMSREFFYLYNNTSLCDCNIAGLIDDTPIKQTYTVDGKKVVSSEVVKDLPVNSTILITAVAHTNVLKNKLKVLGYKGIVAND